MRLDRERLLLQAYDLLIGRPRYWFRFRLDKELIIDESGNGLEWALDNVQTLDEVWVELSGNNYREDVSQLVAELWWRLHRGDVLSDDRESRVVPEFIQKWIEETS